MEVIGFLKTPLILDDQALCWEWCEIMTGTCLGGVCYGCGRSCACLTKGLNTTNFQPSSDKSEHLSQDNQDRTIHNGLTYRR